jgi:hypothetical protein
MLTPPFWCISVALWMGRATCCIEASETDTGIAGLGLPRVLLAESKNKKATADNLISNLGT